MKTPIPKQSLEDEIVIVPHPALDWEPRPILFKADGTPLRRQMGFVKETKG